MRRKKPSAISHQDSKTVEPFGSPAIAIGRLSFLGDLKVPTAVRNSIAEIAADRLPVGIHSDEDGPASRNFSEYPRTASIDEARMCGEEPLQHFENEPFHSLIRARSGIDKSAAAGLTAGVKIPHNSILTVGSLAFDTIQTPAGKAESALGGSGNFFSIAASFYAPVQVVGVVGEDFPKTHLDWLKTRRIDTSGIQVASGKTFHWVGAYDQNLNEAKTISTALNVFEHFNPVLSPTHQQSPYVFLANIDPVLQQRVLDQMPESRLVACDSMNFWITGKLAELHKTLKRVDILSINEGEAFLLSGKRNLVSAAEYIRSLGPSVVVIKRGEYGATLFTDSGIFIAPAFPVSTVIDPTGAGDSFAGAFMGYLSEAGIDRKLASSDPAQWNTVLRRAVLAGCVMASFTVEDFSFNRLMRLEPAELTARQAALMGMISV